MDQQVSIWDSLKTIQEQAESLRGVTSPDAVAELVTSLSVWKSWLGSRLVDAEMEFNLEVNTLMTTLDIPANQALIRAKTGENYKLYAKIKQLYNDLKTVISSGKSQLQLISDERWNR